MKKFSKINKLKIGTEPEKSNYIDESKEFKVKIISLVNEFLKIGYYGSAHSDLLSNDVRIEGKEMLAEAIIGILSDESNKGKVKLLESLKSEIKDWKAIDDKIDSIGVKSPSINNKSRFSSILERYEGDSLLLFIESNIDNIKNKSIMVDYCDILESSNLERSLKEKAISLYKNRIDTL